MLRSLVASLALLASLLVGDRARADVQAGAEAPEVTAQARDAFVLGTSLVEQARWAEALESFERAARLRPHAITSYNLAVCHRALGAYTLARRRYEEALRLGSAQAEGERLPSPVRTEIEGLLAQLDGVVARVEMTIDPAPVKVSIDGRPLLFVGETLALAGARAPAPAEPVTARRFVVELNPGVHTVTVQRDGYADVVETLTTRPGARLELPLQLDRLPSTLRIDSTPRDSVVRVDGVDVGTSPLTIQRPPGPHRIVILRPDYVAYDAQLATHPGEDLRITGHLVREHTPITKRWWFWAGAGAVAVTIAVVSYAVVRSADTPEQAPFDGGTLGWTVPAALRF